MKLKDAYKIIVDSEYFSDAVLHVDHICSEPIAHDSAHCSLSAFEQYTADDAAIDSAELLRERVGS